MNRRRIIRVSVGSRYVARRSRAAGHVVRIHRKHYGGVILLCVASKKHVSHFRTASQPRRICCLFSPTGLVSKSTLLLSHRSFMMNSKNML